MIAHNRPCLGAEEAEATVRVLASGWVAQGPEVEKFEREFCAFLGLPDGHAVAVSSGTAALFLALVVLGASGSQVACPVYSCSALSNAIIAAGATPLFVDIKPNTPNIDVGAAQKSGAAIAILAHMFGQPVEFEPTGAFKVIEDCAQALGARSRGVPVGLRGDVGVFSFYASKLITSGGQGGMLVSRDPALVEAARDYRQFDGRQDRKPRFNLQMTDLQAAVGRVQLQKLPAFMRRRAEIFERYRRAALPLVDAGPGAEPVRFRSVLRSDDAGQIIAMLGQRDIRAIVPIEDWELLGPVDSFPQAAHFSRTTLSLPTYPSLSDADQSRIMDALAAAGFAVVR